MSGADVWITKARMADVPAIAALVERYAKHGEVLPRPLEDIYTTVREWVVARQAGRVVGCGSLVILWADLAEIRSLIVSPDVQGTGIGGQIVQGLLAEAAALEIPEVFTLTRKPGFFLKMGFHKVEREQLPRKIWKDCMHCTKFAGCDEVALVKAPAPATSAFEVAVETVPSSAPGGGDGQDVMVLTDQLTAQPPGGY